MTSEQRWINAHERGLERTIELATAIKGALAPCAIRQYRRELATIKRIRAIVDIYAAGAKLRTPARRARRGAR